MTIDPFMNASPIYQDAKRHPHKSGSGTEGLEGFHDDKPAWLLPVVGLVVVIAGLIAIRVMS